MAPTTNGSCQNMSPNRTPIAAPVTASGQPPSRALDEHPHRTNDQHCGGGEPENWLKNIGTGGGDAFCALRYPKHEPALHHVLEWLLNSRRE